MKALASAESGLHWSGIMVMLYEVMLCLCYGYTMVMLWLHYGYVMAATPAAASARRDAVLCQPGENNVSAVRSYSSLSLLPAS